MPRVIVFAIALLSLYLVFDSNYGLATWLMFAAILIAFYYDKPFTRRRKYVRKNGNNTTAKLNKG